MEDSGDFSFCQVIDKGHSDQLESPRAMPKGSNSLIERDTVDTSSGEVKVDPSFNSGHIRTPASQMSDGSTDNDIADSAKELKALTVKNDQTGLEVSSSGAILHTEADASGSSSSLVDAIIKKKPVQRTKVPFEKGYSQMDWLRITRTHPDLAGLKGQSNRRMISMNEVKQHKGEGSIWTVLRGRVYNITPYLKFHPGGVDMLMKAAGRDCTCLFNKYHAWVNADFLLEKCLVGILDTE